MRSNKLTISSLAMAAFGVFTFGFPASASAIDIAAQIEKVRQANLKYNDIKVALADGFTPAPPIDCVTAAKEGLPAEWGGMGIHYIHPERLNITSSEPRVNGNSTHTDFINPAILLYEPRADGSLKLVGVENLVFLHAWQHAGNQAPPTFAGRSYDTMADNSSTDHDEAHNFEPHMDQHVYFQKLAKPEDQLNPFSPNVTCEHYKK
jgi:hypothetical protein